MKSEYDAIVIGAGPAGCVCAMQLGRAGKKVLLVEKTGFPREKVCADAVTPGTIEMLEELDLLEAFMKTPHKKITGVVFSSPNGTVAETSGFWEKNTKMFSCKRKHFDYFLFKQVKHAEKITGMEAVSVLKKNSKIAGVKCRDARTGRQKDFFSKTLVFADGANQSLSRKLFGKANKMYNTVNYRAYFKGIAGMKGKLEFHFLEKALPGYFWIFPLPKKEANVGIGMVESEIKKNHVDLESLFFEIISTTPFNARFGKARQLCELKKAELPFSTKRNKAAGNCFVLTGDALHAGDARNGAGVAAAMQTGLLAANAIKGSALQKYEKGIEQLFERNTANSIIQAVGKNRVLINFFVKKAKKNPEFARALAGIVLSDEPKKYFLNAAFIKSAIF